MTTHALMELADCICGAAVDQEECPYPHGVPDTGRQLFIVNCTNDNCGWQAIGWGADGARNAWNTRPALRTAAAEGGSDVGEMIDSLAPFVDPVAQMRNVCLVARERDALISRKWVEGWADQWEQERKGDSAAGRDGWLPIESAPKSTRVLVWDGYHVAISMFGKVSHVPIYGWLNLYADVENIEIMERQPTHWKRIDRPAIAGAAGDRDV